MFTEQASAADAGKRLDAFLHEKLPQFSRSRLQGWIKNGRVHVNGAQAKASYLLRGQELINVEPDELPPLRAQPEDLPLQIIYEDSDVIVVDKPAGMVVHVGAGNQTGTLVNALLHHFGTLSTGGDPLRPGIVHRIDKETSGLLVVARTDRAHQSLAQQFHDRKVQKTYLALIHGRMKSSTGTIEAPIARDPVRRTRMTSKLGMGRHAVTHFRVIESFSRFSLLQIGIETGRTHQIRVHLSSLRHPIVGDTLYGAPGGVTAFPNPGRFLLHASKLAFDSPSAGKRLCFESSLPPEFLRVLECLRSATARMDAI